MVFSSHIFVFYFLPAALLVYYALYRAPQRVRNFSLIIMGYIFYGWANPKFIFLMFGTTFLDWMLSLVISRDSWRFWRHRHGEMGPLARGPRTRTQRGALALSVVSNLASLGFFKYFNFGLDSYRELMASFGYSHLQWDTFFRVLLPLGISFYTFQSLSYIIDVYRGDAKATRSFIDFSCFVSMFPHLVAGPILKFSYLADQLEHRSLTLDKFARGVAFFSLGMAKKILIANPCGRIADTVFAADGRSLLDAWYGAVGYAFQIYFDFSGYSDMAIGLGLMLGFVFARNFDHPYRSQSITEFWQRWHISLSTWLREYLYFPLGGNRKGRARTYANLFAVMLLGGLWHGAAWNFAIWGGIHGGALAFERSLGRRSAYALLPGPLRIGITFLIVLVAWVFFRAESFSHGTAYLADMFGLGGPLPAGSALIGGMLYQPSSLLCLALGGVLVWFAKDTWEWTQHLTWGRAISCTVLLWISLAILATQAYNPFIYFIF